MKVDAHQHFWHYGPVRDACLTPKMAAIRRDFKPADLLPRRVLFSSDWPVCNVAGGYGAACSATEQAQLWGTTASGPYSLYT